MGPFSKLLDGFIEGAVLHFHIEMEDVAAGFAAETIIELVFPVHGKGRGLLSVERTEAPVFPAFFVQRNIARHELDDVRPAAELVQPGGGETGGHKTPLSNEK